MNIPELPDEIDMSKIGCRVSYALFWIPASLLLRYAAIHAPETINGLSTPAAALLLLFLQMTIGFAYRDIWVALLAVTLVDHRHATDELFHQVHGEIITHYGMLVTFYLMHNLSLSLTKERPSGVRHIMSIAAASSTKIEQQRVRMEAQDKPVPKKMVQFLDVEKAEEEEQPPRENTYFF